MNRRKLCLGSMLAISFSVFGWVLVSRPLGQHTLLTYISNTSCNCSGKTFAHVSVISYGDTDRLKRANDALPWLSHRLLLRHLSRPERDHCIKLLSRVDDILREFNITYMMAYGTLLGSYVMHDILPWDDDLDIFINIDDLTKIKRLFNASGSGHYKQIQLLESPNISAFTAKLYSLTDPKTGKYSWHWPYIDIAFYKENATRLSIYKKNRNREMTRSDVFPLTLRPLAWRWFPAPRNTGVIVARKYKHFVCKSHNWNHREEVLAKRIHSVNCATLGSHYPFVARQTLVNER
ncbi:hypothetical protein LSAT2_012550, partial [Lamellibrachia satsuma]